MTRLVCLVLSGAALVLAAPASPSAPSSSIAPRTFLVVSGSLRSFVQDGGRFAWIGGGYGVWTRAYAGGKSARLGSAAPWGTVKKFMPGPWLTIAGKRVLWTSSGGGDSTHTNVFTSVPGQAKATFVGGTQADNLVGVNDGSYFGCAAGDGKTLVWSSAHFRCVRPACNELEISTSELFKDGLRDWRNHAIGSVRSAAELDAALGRLALVPSASPVANTEPLPRPAPNGSVEIRLAGNGKLVTSFVPVGTVRAVALSKQYAAVLVERADGARAIETYDSTTGSPVASTAVPSATADDLDISGATVVFRIGWSVRLLDAATGHQRVLYATTAKPIGLSIEGRRVAWGVNTGGHVLIRTIQLPDGA
jgi:hypothetical protein